LSWLSSFVVDELSDHDAQIGGTGRRVRGNSAASIDQKLATKVPRDRLPVCLAFEILIHRMHVFAIDIDLFKDNDTLKLLAELVLGKLDDLLFGARLLKEELIARKQKYSNIILIETSGQLLYAVVFGLGLASLGRHVDDKCNSISQLRKCIHLLACRQARTQFIERRCTTVKRIFAVKYPVAHLFF
jgi:hypothetical protein